MWVRLCVDLDSAGHVLGASLERRDVDGMPDSLHVLERPGPFETPAEAFERARMVALSIWGEQQRLLPG